MREREERPEEGSRQDDSDRDSSASLARPHTERKGSGREAEVAEFARAVVGPHEDGGARRESIRARIGDRALAELALGIAAAGAFPRIKRALGFASACETPPSD